MEKTLYNQVGEVKGKVSEKEDSFSFQFTPQNENLRRTRGSLFTLVTVNGEIKDKYEKAKTFYHAFQSSYYAKASGSIINGLSDTLEQVDRDLVKKSAQVGIDLSIVAAVFWGSVLYLAKIGPSSIYVARGDKLKKLEFSKVASGVLEDQDTVCLATEKLSENLSPEDLANFLSQEKFEKTLESIDKKIASVEGATCIVIRLSINKPEEQTVNLPIGDVDEEGKVDFSETSNTEVSEEPGNPEEQEEQKLDQIDETEEPEAPVQVKEGRKINLPKVNLPIQPILEKASSLGSLAFEKIKSPWVNKDGEIVDPVARKRARIIQVVALVGIILISSLLISGLTRGSKEEQTKADSLVAAAETNINEAKNIKTIDPIRAKTLVEQAKTNLSEAKNQGSKNSKISDLESTIASLIAEITRTYRIENLETEFDFSKIQSDAKTTRLAIVGNNILVTDKGGSNIFSFKKDSREATKVEGSFSEPENVASFTNGFYVQTKDAILRIDANSNTITSLPAGNVWGSVAGAATFQSSLRLVDKSKNEIWNYINTSRGLSSPQAYLKGEKPDLTNASAIAIDDLVWVVTKEGKIYKIALGRNQEFTMSNFNEPFGAVVDFYTTNSTKNHYLLDQGKGRLVIVGKDGVYQSQYGHDSLHEATGLIVSEEEKKVYFVSGSKLYSFNFQ